MGEMGRMFNFVGAAVESDTEILFGVGQRSKLHFSGHVADRAACGLPSVKDLSAAIQEALGKPLDFPAIELAIVPGDRVVLAIDPSMPQLPSVVAGVVGYLIERNVDPQQLTIVVAGHQPADAEAIGTSIAQITSVQIPIELHDADDSNKVAYVAANHEAEPIYVNRTLVDAEVVIPISCARGRGSLDYLGSNTIFPRLSDRKTRGRFYSLARLEKQSEHDKLQAWADEAAWWVGLSVGVQIVPGRDGEIVGVLAGSPAALEEAAQRLMESAWKTSVAEPAEVVLALIDGGRSQQTWDNVARAIHVAHKVTARGGSIIICSQLAQVPGRALRKLTDPDRSSGTLAKQLSSDASDDALAAAVILAVVSEYHIYLYSEIASETIEEFGMGAIENLGQLQHLLGQHASMLLLGSAQYRTVAGEGVKVGENSAGEFQAKTKRAARSIR